MKSDRERVEDAFDIRKVAIAAKRCFGGKSKDHELMRAWLFHLCGLGESVARGTPEETYRAIGRQEVGLSLLEVLEADMAYVHEVYQAALNGMDD